MKNVYMGNNITGPLRRITAIDLGTNSFHAIIVDIYLDGSFYTVDTLKEMVLLKDKESGKYLSEKAMERGMEALRRIKKLSDSRGAELILAYATSAIREAVNGGEFIQQVIDETGIKINAIPGRIEAELIGIAVQHGVKMSEEPALIMDIGGGSVEFIIANHQKIFYLRSKKIGVARITADHLHHDPVTEEEIEALETYFQDQLTEVAQAFAMNRCVKLIGSSGTMQNIASMIAYTKGNHPELSLNEYTLKAEDFYTFYDDVIGMNARQRAKLKGLDEKRISLLPAGLVLVRFVLKTFGIEELKISDQALREGIILRYIKRDLAGIKKLTPIDNPRRRSVMELVHKYRWHKKHSTHVADMALQLFDYYRKDLGLSETDRELLEFAAFMHDIGYLISHRKHHKHALYLIRNADLRGFTEEEIDIMAHTARYHRRSAPNARHEHYNRLEKQVQQRIRKLSGILRIADGLDRSHYQNVRKIEISKERDHVLIEVESEDDPQLEIWGASRKKNLLEEVTGCAITIQAMRERPFRL